MISRRVDGRHMRLSNGRRNRAVGRYASIKNGWSPPWESRFELKDMYRAEVDGTVLSYTTQPETLCWQSGSKSRRYTPDRIDYLADGSRRVIEIKGSYEAERDPDYAEKLAEVADVYNALGVQFQLRDRHLIEEEPTFSAVEEIQAYRRTVVTTTDVDEARRILNDGEQPLGSLLSNLSSPTPRAVVFAMVVRRIVHINLTHGLRQDAVVAMLLETV